MSRISATLSQDDRDAIAGAIATIQQRLPFLIDLVAEERATLPKLGNKTRTFVSKALDVASQNPDFLPRSFKVDEMQKDMQLFEDLDRLLMSLTQLQDMVDDTCVLVGSEAYSAALTVYNYAKTSGVTMNGLEPIVEEMRQHFRKPRKAKAPKVSG
ncbi:hypothetical protein [Leptolyngbya sp. GGD]|uniref:hypothetical protein n=1 Tax=Leptolyngbya sp. GGD TaxID=2997907 RepID=UPI00227A97AA|nr:hypothetical protein [Leptolyngbya sp. GGD]MCY6490809.1 hypothetical protein [Leptolyngbya sp. GGD]